MSAQDGTSVALGWACFVVVLLFCMCCWTYLCFMLPKWHAKPPAVAPARRRLPADDEPAAAPKPAAEPNPKPAAAVTVTMTKVEPIEPEKPDDVPLCQK